jgi:hypothetical protein
LSVRAGRSPGLTIALALVCAALVLAAGFIAAGMGQAICHQEDYTGDSRICHAFAEDDAAWILTAALPPLVVIAIGVLVAFLGVPRRRLLVAVARVLLAEVALGIMFGLHAHYG